MNLPTQRITISPSDHGLLRPGLDILAVGLAEAKRNRYPRRNAWDRILLDRENVYAEKEFDVAMAERIIPVRAKLWEMSVSRRIRVDVFDLAILALACRLQKSKLSEKHVPAPPADVAALERRLETIRKRAKRATIKRIGGEEYRLAAERWSRFGKWCRYNLLTFGEAVSPYLPSRKKHWRTQREQLTHIINTLLASRYYHPLSDDEMKRVVTLLTSSSRRGRLHIGMRELIADPGRFSDRVLSFLKKRVLLKLLPNAPLPAWQLMVNRAEKFKAYEQSRKLPAPEGIRQTPLASPDTVSKSTGPATDTPDDESLMHEPFISNTSLQDALADWFRKEVDRNFWMPVKEQAHFLIARGLTEQYRRSFTSTTLSGLIEELRPPEPPMWAEEPTNEFTGWLLGILLAVRSTPSTIYDGVSHAVGLAIRLKKEESNARWLQSR